MAIKRQRTVVQATSANQHTRFSGPSRTRPKAKNRNVRVPRNKLMFPQSISTKLRYTTKINMGSIGAVGNVKQNQFIANGCYDPDFTGSGHQPRGFDQFMGIYETYTVTASKMAVNFVFDGYHGPAAEGIGGEMLQPSSSTPASAAASAVMCGVYKGMNALAAGSAEQQMEKDRTQWVVMTPNGDSKTLRTSLKVADFFGTSGSLVGMDGYEGTDAANPTNKIYYEVWCGRINPYSTAILRVQAYVTIEFEVTFTEPKPQPQS